MQITIDHHAQVERTVRVAQLEGLFDLEPGAHLAQTIEAELPDNDDWQIGLVVGPSGSGKSSLARQAFAAQLFDESAIQWPAERSLLDHFPPALSIKQITATLTAVGFSSPPAWLRPFHTLSTGERFRCSLAFALLSGSERIVFDEFTSVVDRTVAAVGSAALAKAIRSGHTTCRQFVAVTCHYDVADWLTPDWILDMASGQLARGRLRRPGINLTVRRTTARAWRLFRRHHYLSANIHRACRCYVAEWDDRPVAFVATLAQFGHVGVRRISRAVVLPDFQGVGIGGAVLREVARQEADSCDKLRITSSHPGMIAHCKAAPWWRCIQHRPRGYGNLKKATHSTGRPVATFQFVNSCQG